MLNIPGRKANILKLEWEFYTWVEESDSDTRKDSLSSVKGGRGGRFVG